MIVMIESKEEREARRNKIARAWMFEEKNQVANFALGTALILMDMEDEVESDGNRVLQADGRT